MLKAVSNMAEKFIIFYVFVETIMERIRHYCNLLFFNKTEKYESYQFCMQSMKGRIPTSLVSNAFV